MTPSMPYEPRQRDLDCQAALEPEFQALAERAEIYGWSGDEIAGALLALSIAQIKARIGAAVAHAIKWANASMGEA